MRGSPQLLLDIAERVGFLDDLYLLLNQSWELKPPYHLEMGKRYRFEEIAERFLKSCCGEDKGVEWFRHHGVYTWPKKVEEVYWKPFLKVRVPIYFEFIPRLGQKVRAVAEEMGIPWDVSDFQALPDWKPCLSHHIDSPGYDFYAFYYRVPHHTFSFTVQNAWLHEVGEMDPWTNYVVINARSAARLGIRDGDLVRVESIDGGTTTGRARLSNAIHPEGLALAANSGHWAPGMPLARGVGASISQLRRLTLDRVDIPTNSLDLCIKVKVSKV